MFGEVMRDLELNPHEILQALEEHLRLLPSVAGRDLRVAPSTKLLFKLALLHASRSGRHTIEATDLFSAIFEETQGIPVSIIRRHGIEPEALVSRLATRMRDHELREERLKKRFELPPFLKHFATNLNQLARQDKVPPVFGRDYEMDQVLEVLCHRERANSVLLLGEPGVGKTAIAEGLARRIEFEPEKVPVRLRDCQIVNLQMNTMVAGTMLRGMFEDRIQNVIREIKERPNLILFIDEVHTMIGAGSALGAPSDAANVFKSVLARGEVRIIGATTLSEYKEFIQEDEALARRFRTVQVNEPTIDQTRHILYNLRPRLERNYSVRIQDEAIETALEMSPRYMRHLQLPDKVIGWLDTAAVKAEIGRRWEVTPADVVNVISRVAQIPEDMVFREVSTRFRDICGVAEQSDELPRHPAMAAVQHADNHFLPHIAALRETDRARFDARLERNRLLVHILVEARDAGFDPKGFGRARQSDAGTPASSRRTEPRTARRLDVQVEARFTGVGDSRHDDGVIVQSAAAVAVLRPRRQIRLGYPESDRPRSPATPDRRWRGRERIARVAQLNVFAEDELIELLEHRGVCSAVRSAGSRRPAHRRTGRRSCGLAPSDRPHNTLARLERGQSLVNRPCRYEARSAPDTTIRPRSARSRRAARSRAA